MTRLIKRTTTVVALIAALVAISAPAASARFDLNPPTANSGAQYAEPAQPASESSGSSSSGFNWGDAAIGAAVMLAATGLGGGAVLLTRRGRGQAATG